VFVHRADLGIYGFDLGAMFGCMDIIAVGTGVVFIIRGLFGIIRFVSLIDFLVIFIGLIVMSAIIMVVFFREDIEDTIYKDLPLHIGGDDGLCEVKFWHGTGGELAEQSCGYWGLVFKGKGFFVSGSFGFIVMRFVHYMGIVKIVGRMLGDFFQRVICILGGFIVIKEIMSAWFRGAVDGDGGFREFGR
jgi:hypothetical protein